MTFCACQKTCCWLLPSCLSPILTRHQVLLLMRNQGRSFQSRRLLYSLIALPLQGPEKSELKRDFTYIDDIVDGIMGALAEIPPSQKGTAHYKVPVGLSPTVGLRNMQQLAWCTVAMPK